MFNLSDVNEDIITRRIKFLEPEREYLRDFSVPGVHTDIRPITDPIQPPQGVKQVLS